MDYSLSVSGAKNFTESTEYFGYDEFNRTLRINFKIDDLNTEIFSNELFYSTLFMFIYICVGTVGNILVIYVFWSNKRKTASSIFILALAATDIVNCVFPMPVEIALLLNFLKFDHPFICKASRFVTYACTNMTTGVLIAIAACRYQRIFRPFQKQLTSKKAIYVVLLCFLISLGISWPFLLLYGTFTIEIKMENTVVFGKTCLIEDSMLKTSYPLYSAIIICVGHFFCDVTLIVLYACIGSSVCKQYIIRRNSNKDNPTQNESRGTQIRVTFQPRSEHFYNAKGIHANREACTKNTVLTNVVNSNNRNIHLVAIRAHKNDPSSASHTRNNITQPRRRMVERTSMMLFLITLVFILAYLPFSILILLRALCKNFYAELSNTEKTIYQLFLRFYFLSSVLNPIVYYNVNQKFRKSICSFAKSSVR